MLRSQSIHRLVGRRVAHTAVCAAALTAVAVFAALFSTSSAVARIASPLGGMPTVPPGHIMNVGTGGCLDSNYKGAVYLSPCWPNDKYQKWHLTDGGTDIVDNQTGRCLDANHHQGVFTNRCSTDDLYEIWSPAVVNGEANWENEGEGAWALDANNHHVFTAPYASRNRYQNHDRDQVWIGPLP